MGLFFCVVIFVIIVVVLYKTTQDNTAHISDEEYAERIAQIRQKIKKDREETNEIIEKMYKDKSKPQEITLNINSMIINALKDVGDEHAELVEEILTDKLDGQLTLNSNYENEISKLTQIQKKWQDKEKLNFKIIENKEFESVEIPQFPENSACEIVYNYFYLLNIFKELYKFKTDKKAFEKLELIDIFLNSNLDIIKDNLRVFEYLRAKAYNIDLKHNKTDAELKKQAMTQFNKINFEHIEENHKKIQYYKEKYK